MHACYSVLATQAVGADAEEVQWCHSPAVVQQRHQSIEHEGGHAQQGGWFALLAEDQADQ